MAASFILRSALLRALLASVARRRSVSFSSRLIIFLPAPFQKGTLSGVSSPALTVNFP
jgi:hypothetical protein